jgi:hypothetical protein
MWKRTVLHYLLVFVVGLGVIGYTLFERTKTGAGPSLSVIGGFLILWIAVSAVVYFGTRLMKNVIERRNVQD